MPSFATNEKSQSQTVLLITDLANLHTLQNSLRYHNCNVQAVRIEDLVNAQIRSDLLETMKSNPPSVFWIHTPSWDVNLKIDDQRRIAIALAVMLSYQLARPTHHIVLEGDLHRYRNWYPDRLRRALAHPRLSSHNVWWCSVGMKLSEKPICRYSKVICTLPSLPLNLVNCCQTDSKSSFRRFKASRTVLQEFQHKLHDVIVPLFWPRRHGTETNYPVHSQSDAEFQSSKKPSRPIIPKKIASAPERLGHDEPGEHADDQFTKDDHRPKTRPKTKEVENVFDDCGDDTTALGEEVKFVLFEDSTYLTTESASEDSCSDAHPAQAVDSTPVSYTHLTLPTIYSV